MTLIPLLVTSGDFCLQYGLGLVLVMDWDCLLVSFLVTIRIGTASLFPF